MQTKYTTSVGMFDDIFLMILAVQHVISNGTQCPGDNQAMATYLKFTQY